MVCLGNGHTEKQARLAEHGYGRCCQPQVRSYSGRLASGRRRYLPSVSHEQGELDHGRSGRQCAGRKAQGAAGSELRADGDKDKEEIKPNLQGRHRYD